MSLKQNTVSHTLPDNVPPASGELRRDGPRPVDKGQRWVALITALVGVGLIFLAAGDALAGASGSSTEIGALRGTDGKDRLNGSGGDDGILGHAGDDALAGGGGSDEIYGGPGRDLMFGGSGDDFIEAKDGARDFVDCGPGLDVASVDAADRVASNCETVYP